MRILLPNKSTTQSLVWSHPLTKGLVGAWIFNQAADLANADLNKQKFYDLLYREPLSMIRINAGGLYGALSGPTGFGVRFNNVNSNETSERLQSIASPPRFMLTSEVSWFWRGCVYANPDASAPPLMAMEFNGGFTDPFYAYGVRRNGNTNVDFWHNAGGSSHTINVAVFNTSQYGKVVSLGMSRSAPLASTKCYKDGVQVGSDTQAGSLAYGAGTPHLTVNTSIILGGATSAKSFVDVLYVWNRALTAFEHSWLASHPYDFISPVLSPSMKVAALGAASAATAARLGAIINNPVSM